MYKLYLQSPTKGVYLVTCVTKEIYTLLLPYSVPAPMQQ